MTAGGACAPLCPAPSACPAPGQPLGREGQEARWGASAAELASLPFSFRVCPPLGGVQAQVPGSVLCHCDPRVTVVGASELPSQASGHSDLEAQRALLTEWQTAEARASSCGSQALGSAPPPWPRFLDLPSGAGTVSSQPWELLFVSAD